MSTHTSLPEGGTAGRTGDRKACHRERCCSAGRQCRYHLSSLVLGWRVGPVTPCVLLLAVLFASHHAMTCYPSVLVEPGWQTSACMGRTGPNAGCARTADRLDIRCRCAGGTAGQPPWPSRPGRHTTDEPGIRAGHVGLWRAHLHGQRLDICIVPASTWGRIPGFG